MRRALEKLTFVLLSLAATSLVSFVLLSRVTDARAGRLPSQPLLFNPQPNNVRNLTLAAVRDVASAGPRAELGRAQLARLGGAALPFVLPALDSLEPVARGRVALALAPVARRMGVADDAELATPERAIAFFTRFWQDRGVDFRGAAVRRKVQRLADRALALRRKEVIELDTFALAELLDALGPIGGPEDVKRVARLTPVLAHVTGNRWTVAPNATPREASDMVARWRGWALEHRSDFVSLDGPGRLSAMLLQTRYFRWLSSVRRAVTGEDPHGRGELDRVLSAARSSVVLGVLGIVGGVLLGAGFAVARDRSLTAARYATSGVMALSALPLAYAALRGAVLAGFGVFLSVALIVGATIAVELGAARPTQGRLRQAVARSGPLVPLALSAVLAGEAALGVGLGALALEALGRSDLSLLMWIALALSAVGALAATTTEGALRVRAADATRQRELEPAPRRRVFLVAAVASIALLAAFALVGPLLGQGTVAGFARQLGGTLVTLGAALGAAVAVTLLVGLLAGGISRSFDTGLTRVLELVCALPQPLFSCWAFSLGTVTGAAVLGSLRGVEIAHVLRSRLAEQRASDELDRPSTERAPLAPYLRRLLPLALAPAATALALTVPWLASLEAATARLGAATPGTLGSTLARGSAAGGAAVLVLVLLGLALLLLVHELTPRESDDANASAVVLPLKRRLNSDAPPPPDPVRPLAASETAPVSAPEAEPQSSKR
jgi:ABC-type dipeptide/oligopeptide/nickel transport system permease subunit